ncbi:MAG TPA: hypothetical protein VMT00_12615 [Thermoanaerobaculia bacterium]|nr:hypothetical protein [Thermoanaerobaculia bacterium]
MLCYDSFTNSFGVAMQNPFSELGSFAVALPIGLVLLLLAILIISFRSRAFVFCQYLQTMTGISLKPSEVRRVFRERGREGVRELFLDLIIREDLKQGPLQIPTAPGTKRIQDGA